MIDMVFLLVIFALYLICVAMTIVVATDFICRMIDKRRKK